MGALRDNYAHINIRESLLGIAVVGSCPVLSNQCTFGLTNQQSGSYAPANYLEIIRFWPLYFKAIVWNVSTQVKKGDISTYVHVFDLRRGNQRRLVTFVGRHCTSQDIPFDIILWYIVKTIPTFLE